MVEITTTDSGVPELQALLNEALNSFNQEAAGYSDRRPLAVVVRDDAGVVVGGAAGRTAMGVAFLDLFYLPPDLRGSGVGSDVLRRFEAEGRARGCRMGVLFTISFQAPGFYEKQGWERFGEIPCDPPGTSRIWFRKAL